MEIYAKDNKVLSYNNKYIKPKASSETWVLNETLDLSSKFDYSINFNSNGTEFIRMVSGGTLAPGVINYNLDYYMASGLSNAYFGEFNSWNNQAYRTITFLEPPTGELLAWLQSNGVK